MPYTFKHGDRPLDDYTIQRAVGAGGFGEVYYAMSDGGREVALKYLRDNPHVELRGVSHCINLKSPHLVSIFDVKKNADGEYFIIMEYCSGPSLRDLLIAEPNGFEPQKAAFFVREIAKGLAYLHDRGIVHRDLKPGNIFYDDGYAKIGDYGLSKFISVSRHSAQTSSVGTVHYMAPEIGSGNYSRGVDIYALGVMLYEMLLGKVPFEGSTMGEVLMKHLTAQPAVDELPNPFGKVIRKALQKDPKDRYQTVNEMVEEMLAVEEVQQSLAGFSPQSLAGAVRYPAGDRNPSPAPSPNPQPRMGRAARPTPPEVGAQEVVFSRRMRARMDRIANKLDRKLDRLGGPSQNEFSPIRRPMIPDAPEPARRHAREGQQKNRGKRILLSASFSLGLAIGLGTLAGNVVGPDETGASVGMWCLALPGGVLLSRRVTRWFDAESGPNWTRIAMRIVCCVPLIFLGSAPMLDSWKNDEALAVTFGLIAVALLVNWEKTYRNGTTGALQIGRAILAAFLALIVTGISTAIADGDPVTMPLAMGIAAVSSFSVQTLAWAFGSRGEMAPTPPTRPPTIDETVSAKEPAVRVLPASEEDAPSALPPPVAWAIEERLRRAEAGSGSGHRSAQASRGSGRSSGSSSAGPRARWAATRAFWGFVSFALTGGAIVTLLLACLGQIHPNDVTACIIACIGMSCGMLFAIRKTSPVKKNGFWRETARPFLISASLFGIGGSMTAMIREWCTIGPDGHIMAITGAVFSTLLFFCMIFLPIGDGGRQPAPFLKDSDSAVEPSSAASAATAEESLA